MTNSDQVDSYGYKVGYACDNYPASSNSGRKDKKKDGGGKIRRKMEGER